MEKLTNFDSLKQGDILSEVTYYEVITKNVNSTYGYSLKVKDSNGGELSITKELVEKNLVSASQFTNEKNVSLTELATILSETNGQVFEACFNKLPNAEVVAQTLSTLNAGKFPTNAEIAHIVDEVYKGETRVLRGYLTSIEPLMGRARVVDLEVKFNPMSKDAGYRFIDLRTLRYLIFKGTKFINKNG